MAGININLVITDEMLKEAAEASYDANDVLWGVVNDYVSNIRHNIEIVNNTYTQMGYEIALDILKTVLKERGYKFDDIFPVDEEEF